MGKGRCLSMIVTLSDPLVPFAERVATCFAIKEHL